MAPPAFLVAVVAPALPPLAWPLAPPAPPAPSLLPVVGLSRSVVVCAPLSLPGALLLAWCAPVGLSLSGWRAGCWPFGIGGCLSGRAALLGCPASSGLFWGCPVASFRSLLWSAFLAGGLVSFSAGPSRRAPSGAALRFVFRRPSAAAAFGRRSAVRLGRPVAVRRGSAWSWVVSLPLAAPLPRSAFGWWAVAGGLRGLVSVARVAGAVLGAAV